jgi:hypothetical protein
MVNHCDQATMALPIRVIARESDVDRRLRALNALTIQAGTTGKLAKNCIGPGPGQDSGEARNQHALNEIA